MNDSPRQEEIATAPELPLPVHRAPHVEELQARTPNVQTPEIQPADVQTDTMSSPTSRTIKLTVDDTPATTPPAVSHSSPTIPITSIVKHQYLLRDCAKHRRFKLPSTVDSSHTPLL